MGDEKLLFVRPADDAGAAKLADWGEALQRLFPGGFDDVYADAGRAPVEACLSRGPRALVWLGHGRPDALLVAGLPVIDSQNVGALAGKVIVAVACEAASVLGPTATGQGVRGFLGFRRVLNLPSADPQPVGTALVEGLSCLFAEGHALDCAAARLKSRFDVGADRYYWEAQQRGFQNAIGAPSDAYLAYMAVLVNREGVCVVGEGAAGL
jgi:hypothetical protein